MTKENNGGYVLKRGVVFTYRGKLYSALNVTAEAAEWYIKQDLNHRSDFEVLAKDYESYEKEVGNRKYEKDTQRQGHSGTLANID